MFRLKITVMAIFTEIHSFRLNVAWDTKCCMGQSFIQFLWEQIEFIAKMCLLDGFVGYLENIKSATPCSINKCLKKCVWKKYITTPFTWNF